MVAPPGSRSGGGLAKILAVLSGVIVIALVGVIAFLLVSGGDETAKPAPVDTITPVADESATTVSVEVEETASLTDDQKRAAKEARDYLGLFPRSRAGVIEFLMHDSEGLYSEEDAEIVVDSLGVDWDLQANQRAEGAIEYAAFSKPGLVRQLQGELFTQEQATEAVEGLDVDWSIQAERSARETSQNIAISRSRLLYSLTDDGFTEVEAERGITDADIDFNKEAAEAADEYVLNDSNITCDDLILRLTDGGDQYFGDEFTVEEADYAAETSGVC